MQMDDGDGKNKILTALSAASTVSYSTRACNCSKESDTLQKDAKKSHDVFRKKDLNQSIKTVVGVTIPLNLNS